MPSVACGGKLYRLFTNCGLTLTRRGGNSAPCEDTRLLIAIAATMFVWLFGWGSDYFSWSDPSGTIQLALFTSFVLGIVCGYKIRT